MKEYNPGQIVNRKQVVKEWSRTGTIVYYLCRCLDCEHLHVIGNFTLPKVKSCSNCARLRNKSILYGRQLAGYVPKGFVARSSDAKKNNLQKRRSNRSKESTET